MKTNRPILLVTLALGALLALPRIVFLDGQEVGVEICDDGQDNDADGHTDCDDAD